MSSSIPSIPSEQGRVLSDFALEVSRLSALAPPDKVQKIFKALLQGDPIDSLHLDSAFLEGKVRNLYQLLNPALSSKANKVAVDILKGKMIEVLEDKLLEGKITSMLSKVPPYRIPYFKSTVEEFYGVALSEGKTPQEALAFALAKGLMRLLVQLPTKEEIQENQELMKTLDSDPDLVDCECIISRDRVLLDAVYLIGENGQPVGPYHQDVLTDWIKTKGQDPIIRNQRRSESDIKPDYQVRGIVEEKLFTLLYPEICSSRVSLELTETLDWRPILLELSFAYPLMEQAYETALSRLGNPHLAINEAEEYGKHLLDNLRLIIEAIRFEEVPPSCFPYLEEFLRQSETRLNEGVSLEDVQAEFRENVQSFIRFFYEIKDLRFDVRMEEKALKIGQDALAKGARSDDAIERAVDYLHPLSNNETMKIRDLYPGALIGAEEWTQYLGRVSEVPIPKGISKILNQPSVGIEGQKEGARIGDTHVLMLIPEEVNRLPLTLSQLGKLLKKKGHFQETETGFVEVGLEVYHADGGMRAPPYWVLISRNILSGTRSKGFDEQMDGMDMLSRETKLNYQVPSALEVAALNVMTYLISGEEKTRLFGDNPKTYTRSADSISAYPLAVGGFSSGGLHLDYHNFKSVSIGLAVAVSRFDLPS